MKHEYINNFSNFETLLQGSLMIHFIFELQFGQLFTIFGKPTIYSTNCSFIFITKKPKTHNETPIGK